MTGSARRNVSPAKIESVEKRLGRKVSSDGQKRGGIGSRGIYHYPRDEGQQLARDLVEQRLAACVNVVSKIESYFWWDDAVNTMRKRRCLQDHRREVPRADGVHPRGAPVRSSRRSSRSRFPTVLPEYLAWVRKETEE